MYLLTLAICMTVAYRHDRRVDKRRYPHDREMLKCLEMDTF